MMIRREDSQLVLLEMDDQIATITLNNPPANVLSQSMCEQLVSTFESLRKMNICAVIICGMGNHSFCTGADINELSHN